MAHVGFITKQVTTARLHRICFSESFHFKGEGAGIFIHHLRVRHWLREHYLSACSACPCAWTNHVPKVRKKPFGRESQFFIISDLWVQRRGQKVEHQECLLSFLSTD